jgi:hypothetical protein
VGARDRIEFGPPGPPQTIAYDDAVAAASVTFRISHDARYDAGPAGVSPSISSGSLTMRAFGIRRRYDLSTILPITTDRVILSTKSSCGTATALSRRGGYLVVEAVLAEKGCAPIAVFIDLHDGRVAREAIFDPAWAHRFDVHPYHASGAPFRVARVERVVPEGFRPNSDGAMSRVAWPFLVVHAMGTRGAMLLFAIDLGNQPNVDEAAVAFKSGDEVLVGSSDIGDPQVLVQFFSGERFVRPEGGAEARFDARETPTPDYLQAQMRRNAWFDEANHRASRGDFVGAVDAFATMVSFHGGGDDIDAHDAAMLATCRNLVKRVRLGAVSAAVASGSFSNGCILPTSQERRPRPKPTR